MAGKIELPTLQGERSSAQHNGVDEWSALDVFDNPRKTRPLKHRPSLFDEFRGVLVAAVVSRSRVRLTRRARVNRVELHPVVAAVFQSIALDEVERISFLALDVDTDDLGEASSMVSHRTTASTTIQIEQPHGRSPGGLGFTTAASI
jgi:hypothetical protein